MIVRTLRNYIEGRERLFHARDNNRKSLPFEWGLDHLGIDSNGNASHALHDFVNHALSDSASFYRCDAAPAYEFDGEKVKFSSSVRTPYAENNIVWARYFDGGKDVAVVVLPQWNCKWDSYVRLCRMLQGAGISSLRLSLPYHHYRKPPELERSEYLVSSNIGRTITAVRQAVLDARRAADWLVDRGYRHIGILGTSIGSCVGFLTFAHDSRFDMGVFVHVSSYFADVVWKGLSTRHVRQALDGAIGLEELRFLWSPISPYPFIERLRGSNRKILMLSGRFDPTFLPDLSEQAFAEFDRCGVPYQLAWLPCGHYTMGQFPFNVIAGYRIVRFLTDPQARRNESRSS